MRARGYVRARAGVFGVVTGLSSCFTSNPVRRSRWDGSAVGDGAVQCFKDFVTKELGLESDKQVNIIVSSAKDFLGEQLSLATVSQFFPPEEELFQEIRSEAATPAEDEGPRLVASG